jgi:hypothetical protein
VLHALCAFLALSGLGGCTFDTSGFVSQPADGAADHVRSDRASDLSGEGRDIHPSDRGSAPDLLPADLSPADLPAGDVADGPAPDMPCVPVVLVASKSYEPASTWDMDLHDFSPHQITFAVPSELEVTAGNAGNHCSFLDIEQAGALTRCAYKGGAATAHPNPNSQQYQLGLKCHIIECRVGASPLFAECNEQQTGQLASVGGGDTVPATTVKLEVNGDSHAGPTEVTLTLEGACTP